MSAEAFVNLSDDDARAVANAVSNVLVMAFVHDRKYGQTVRALVLRSHDVAAVGGRLCEDTLPPHATK